MKRLVLGVVLRLVVAGAITGCGVIVGGVNAPIPNTPAPEEPCGHVEYQCGATVFCCPNDMVCGGEPFSGCQTASCCYTGSDEARPRLTYQRKIGDTR